jgi:FKBP-type peptidyl-prolyl cis-trans isomerase SlpA
MPQIDTSSFLTLHYRLSGPQGDIINTFNDKPATLSLGTGELSPAMEQRLLGLEEGTHTTFDLPAGEAFGERNAQMIQWVAKKLLAQHGDPLEKYSIGDVVQFPAPSGEGTTNQSYAGAVREVQADKVLFDFNHPLAGQPVSFEVKVIGVL